MSINIFDPVRNYHLHKSEFDETISNIINSGKYVNGPEVTQLEDQLSKFIGCKYSIGVSSGTDALLMALMALDIQPGDEIITTPFTWISSSEVISLLRAIPVFVDINPKTFNIDETKIQAKITSKTKAILPVSLFGKMCNLSEIMNIAKQNNVFVIEDAAQSLGSRLGDINSCSLADISCTSFYPTKSLGCWGDGGACFTNNLELYEKILAIRNHGGKERDHHTVIGINGRLDTLQAGILLVKLNYLNSDLESRRNNANRYNQHLKKLKNIEIPFCNVDDYHIYSQYTIIVKNGLRDNLLDYLKNHNINVSVFYPTSLHMQPCFKYLNYLEGDFLNSENIGKMVISLPVYPELKLDEQMTVIEKINDWDIIT